MTHAPFSVSSSGQITNAPGEKEKKRLPNRLAMLEAIESGFIKSNRGELPKAHRDVYKGAVNLMISQQMTAFDVDKAAPELGLAAESQQTKDAYGTNGFGQGLLLARRLAQVGVPFIEVNMGGLGSA